MIKLNFCDYHRVYNYTIDESISSKLMVETFIIGRLEQCDIASIKKVPNKHSIVEGVGMTPSIECKITIKVHDGEKMNSKTIEGKNCYHWIVNIEKVHQVKLRI